MTKDLFRKFREFVRRPFLSFYQKKQYHWISATKRIRVREFFTEGDYRLGFRVDPEFYQVYEYMFFELIHPLCKFEQFGIKCSKENDGNV